MALRNEVPCSCGTVTRGKQWAEVARPSWQLEEAAAAHRLQCGGAPELEATFRTTVEKCGEVARMELMQELVRVEAWILALLEAQQSIVWPSPSGEWWRDKQRAKARGEAELTSFGKATHLPSAARCGQSESKSELSFGFSLYRSDRWQLKLMSVSSRNKMLKHFQQSVIEAFGKPYVEGALVLIQPSAVAQYYTMYGQAAWVDMQALYFVPNYTDGELGLASPNSFLPISPIFLPFVLYLPPQACLLISPPYSNAAAAA